jgi:hypothetical protein
VAEEETPKLMVHQEPAVQAVAVTVLVIQVLDKIQKV